MDNMALLQDHLHWQAMHYESPLAGEASFIVLSPGDRHSQCTRGTPQKCRGRAFAAAGRTPPTRIQEGAASFSRWDDELTGHGSRHRPLPGLGNGALPLVSAAVLAIVTGRVLLLENWTYSRHAFAAPLLELLVDGNPWEPFLQRAQRISHRELFLAHDDFSSSSLLCSTDLANEATVAQRVWRIYSNQWFLPLLRANPHHANAILAMAPDGGLFSAMAKVLMRPSHQVSTLIDSAHATWNSAALRGALGHAGSTGQYIAMHVRCSSNWYGCSKRVLHAAVRCARARLKLQPGKAAEKLIFVAAQHAHMRLELEAALNSTARVHFYGPPPGVFETSTRGGWSAELEINRLVDAWLLAQGNETLISLGSTYSDVVRGLARGSVFSISNCVRVSTNEDPRMHVLHEVKRRESKCRPETHTHL